MAENIGGVFNAKIPSISDNADIQTAFRLYHYGLSTPGSPDADSISGHFEDLTNSKLNLDPTTIPTTVDLNTYTTTGFYTQTSIPTGPNYPSSSNLPGLLTVVNKENTIFQQYQVVGAPESGSLTNTLNRTHWRFYFSGAWRPWRTFIDASDFATIGDGRYFTETEVNSLFLSKADASSTYLTISSADARQYISENVVTGNYSLALSDVSKVVSVNNSATATITIPNSSSVDFPIGTLINVYAQTANTVFVSAAVGVALRPTQTIQLFEQYTEISLRYRGGNEWVASGNILKI